MSTQVTGHWRKQFDYRFLAGDELKGEIEMEIASVETDTVEDKGKKKKVTVIRFKGAKKGVVLNKTNAKRIAAKAGYPDVEKWVGVKITLYPELVSAFGTTTLAVRVKDEPNIEKYV